MGVRNLFRFGVRRQVFDACDPRYRFLVDICAITARQRLRSVPLMRLVQGISVMLAEASDGLIPTGLSWAGYAVLVRRYNDQRGFAGPQRL